MNAPDQDPVPRGNPDDTTPSLMDGADERGLLVDYLAMRAYDPAIAGHFREFRAEIERTNLLIMPALLPPRRRQGRKRRRG